MAGPQRCQRCCPCDKKWEDASCPRSSLARIVCCVRPLSPSDSATGSQEAASSKRQSQSLFNATTEAVTVSGICCHARGTAARNHNVGYTRRCSMLNIISGCPTAQNVATRLHSPHSKKRRLPRQRLVFNVLRGKDDVLIDQNIEFVARPDPNRRLNVQILGNGLLGHPTEGFRKVSSHSI